jgi:hypothetical protein
MSEIENQTDSSALKMTLEEIRFQISWVVIFEMVISMTLIQGEI